MEIQKTTVITICDLCEGEMLGPLIASESTTIVTKAIEIEVWYMGRKLINDICEKCNRELALAIAKRYRKGNREELVECEHGNLGRCSECFGGEQPD